MEGRVCKRCLLRETDEAQAYQNMFDYIARLPLEDKTSDEEYERRLHICKECDYLLKGMCRLCGCFVEMRAAMRVKGCPHVPNLWKNDSNPENAH